MTDDANSPVNLPDPDETTRMLQRVSSGDSDAANQLFPSVYDQLRALAGRYFAGRDAGHTLQATAIVHEAYLKLVDQSSAKWNDRAHFFAIAATAMRQILLNHWRDRNAVKRGGGRQKFALDENIDIEVTADVDMIALDDALNELAQLDERKARVVELRFFAGLTVEEVAHVLGVSKTTVEGDWRMARAWLSKELAEDSDE